MTIRLIFSPAADEDLAAIFCYYQSVAPHVVPSLEKGLDDVIARLQTFPELYQLFSPPLRRAHLGHFPFTLYYRVNHDVVEIAAILPQQIDPATIDKKLI